MNRHSIVIPCTSVVTPTELGGYGGDCGGNWRLEIEKVERCNRWKGAKGA